MGGVWLVGEGVDEPAHGGFGHVAAFAVLPFLVLILQDAPRSRVTESRSGKTWTRSSASARLKCWTLLGQLVNPGSACLAVGSPLSVGLVGCFVAHRRVETLLIVSQLDPRCHVPDRSSGRVDDLLTLSIFRLASNDSAAALSDNSRCGPLTPRSGVRP